MYIVLPEEDTTKYFIVSLVIQQINAELTAMADRLGGSLPKKVLCFHDELGTIPKIEGLDAIELPRPILSIWPKNNGKCLAKNQKSAAILRIAVVGRP